MDTEIYSIKFKTDELELVRGNCKYPWLCTCRHNIEDHVKCGYTAAEAHQRFIDYFQRRVDHLKSLTTDQFMKDLGFYDYEGE